MAAILAKDDEELVVAEEFSQLRYTPITIEGKDTLLTPLDTAKPPVLMQYVEKQRKIKLFIVATMYAEPPKGGVHETVYAPLVPSWILTRRARWCADWRGETTTLNWSPPTRRRVPVTSHATTVKRAVVPSCTGPLEPSPGPKA